MTVSLRVHLFGRYAELLGSEELELSLPTGGTVADAVTTLRARPGGEHLPAEPLTAVNATQQPPSTPLKDGDELALLPPLAGG